MKQIFIGTLLFVWSFATLASQTVDVYKDPT